jgi:hypothetical protein
MITFIGYLISPNDGFFVLAPKHVVKLYNNTACNLVVNDDLDRNSSGLLY